MTFIKFSNSILNTAYIDAVYCYEAEKGMYFTTHLLCIGSLEQKERGSFKYAEFFANVEDRNRRYDELVKYLGAK